MRAFAGQAPGSDRVRARGQRARRGAVRPHAPKAKVERQAAIVLKADRRGTIGLDTAWAALARAARPALEAARSSALDRRVLITPNIRQLREASAQMMNREAMFGIKAQLHIGEGAEFEALADYRQGMDRRALDWKQSARHTRADRQGISHRAQQQYRDGPGCRAGDVRAARRACRGSTGRSRRPCSPPSSR